MQKNIANNHTLNYPGQPTENFTLSNTQNAVLTELYMEQRGGILYPIYGVSFLLNHPFVHGIDELQVGVWADTGQVTGVNVVMASFSSTGTAVHSSFGNYVPLTGPTSTPIQTTSEPKIENKISSSNTAFIAAVISLIVFAVVISAVAVVVKNRKNKRQKDNS